jgi:hypothetical protein
MDIEQRELVRHADGGGDVETRARDVQIADDAIHDRSAIVEDDLAALEDAAPRDEALLVGHGRSSLRRLK